MLKNIVEELIASGLKEHELAELALTSQPTINRIRNNQQNPSYDLGKRLEVLHARRCSKEAAA